jgi:hypothetical protein
MLFTGNIITRQPRGKGEGAKRIAHGAKRKEYRVVKSFYFAVTPPGWI